MCASYDCIASYILHFSTMKSSNDDKRVRSTETVFMFLHISILIYFFVHVR